MRTTIEWNSRDAPAHDLAAIVRWPQGAASVAGRTQRLAACMHAALRRVSDMASTSRPLQFAVLAIVVSFLFSLWLSQKRLEHVELWVYEIAANAEPSAV